MHACDYNWVRKHATIGTTPAKAAGLTDRKWTVVDLLGLLEAEENGVIGTEKHARGK